MGKSQEEKLNTTQWKEYKTADGRDYFYNPVTKQSVWEMPAELKQLREVTKKKEESEEEEESEQEEEKKEEEWATPEAKRAAFRELLDDKGVKSTSKWEEAVKLINEDRRFNALTSAGERKQEFSVFVTQKKKREKEEERQKKVRAKDDFQEALSKWDGLKANARYKEAAEAFYEEEFYKLMEEDDRDELFQDYMDEYEKKLKEERRAQRKEQVEKIKASYTSHEEISLTSKWKDVQELLKDEETYKWLSKLEALTSWEEWVTESEKKEVEVKGKAKFRHERLTRDGFRDLMRDCLKEGELKLTSVWKDFAKTATKEDRYLAMIGMSGSTPHELFDDFLEELNDKYKDDRAKIKKFAKAAGVVVTSNSTYEEFHEKLKGEKEYLEMPKEHRVGVFDSLFSKVKEQDENAEKNAKKNRKRFVELLQKSRDMTATTTYDQAAKLLGSSSAWESVDDSTRRQCFDIFVDQLKIQSKSRKQKSPSDDGSEQASEEPKKKVAKGKEKASRKKKEEPEEEPKKSKKKRAAPESEE